MSGLLTSPCTNANHWMCMFHENDDDQGPAAPSEAWRGSRSPLDPLEASRPKNDQWKIPGRNWSKHGRMRTHAIAAQPLSVWSLLQSTRQTSDWVLGIQLQPSAASMRPWARKYSCAFEVVVASSSSRLFQTDLQEIAIVSPSPQTEAERTQSRRPCPWGPSGCFFKWCARGDVHSGDLDWSRN